MQILCSCDLEVEQRYWFLDAPSLTHSVVNRTYWMRPTYKDRSHRWEELNQELVFVFILTWALSKIIGEAGLIIWPLRTAMISSIYKAAAFSPSSWTPIMLQWHDEACFISLTPLKSALSFCVHHWPLFPKLHCEPSWDVTITV